MGSRGAVEPRGVNERLRAIPDAVDVLVVEDGDAPVHCDRPGSRVLDMPSSSATWGRTATSRPANRGVPHFGFYYVSRETDYKYVITLDDDVVARRDSRKLWDPGWTVGFQRQSAALG